MKLKSVVQNSFKLNVIILKCIGLCPLKSYPRFYKFYSYTMCIIAIAPGSLLGFIQFFLEEHTDGTFDVVSFSLVVLTPKLISIVSNSENIQKSIAYLDMDIFVNQSEHHMDLVNACVRICRRNSNVFSFGCLVATCGWYGTKCFGDHSQLPLHVWLPFTDIPTFYNFLYFNLFFAITYCGFAIVATDTIYAGLICHATGQIQVLKENLRHLENNKIVEKCNFVYEKITHCIDHYAAIAHLVKQYERSFSSAIFCQFFHSVVTICICCLQISKLKNIDLNVMILTNYLLFMLVQVYYYCYYGTELIEENNTLIDAIYMTNWYEYDHQSKKALFILMERSKRSLAFTAGKLVDVSLETFTQIIKRSYSLLAVLRSYYTD